MAIFLFWVLACDLLHGHYRTLPDSLILYQAVSVGSILRHAASKSARA
jgi:hypothetical protein